MSKLREFLSDYEFLLGRANGSWFMGVPLSELNREDLLVVIMYYVRAAEFRTAEHQHDLDVMAGADE